MTGPPTVSFSTNNLFDVCLNSFDLWDLEKINTVKTARMCSVQIYPKLSKAPKYIFSLYSFYAYSGVLGCFLFFSFFFALWGGNSRKGSCCTSENSPQALVGKHVLNVIVSLRAPKKEGGHGREWRQTFEKRIFFFKESERKKKNSLQLDSFSCEAKHIKRIRRRSSLTIKIWRIKEEVTVSAQRVVFIFTFFRK